MEVCVRPTCCVSNYAWVDGGLGGLQRYLRVGENLGWVSVGTVDRVFCLGEFLMAMIFFTYNLV